MFIAHVYCMRVDHRIDALIGFEMRASSIHIYEQFAINMFHHEEVSRKKATNLVISYISYNQIYRLFDRTNRFFVQLALSNIAKYNTIQKSTWGP
jgi:hypothetical protein